MPEPRPRPPVGVVAWWCLMEARPSVQLMFLLRVLSGWALTASWPLDVPIAPLAIGLFAWFCVVVSGYLLNGVTDIREDRANASRRPIARGDLPPELAAWIAVVVAVLGVLAGLATSWWLAALALCAMPLGWLYSVPSWRLKRHSLGVVASILVGIALTYYAGAVIAAAQAAAGGDPSAAGLPYPGTELLVFAAALALWTALVGGTTKDLPDQVGDRAAGTRGWLAGWGERRFRYAVSAAALLLAVGFVALAGWVASRLLPSAAVLLAGAGVVTGLLLAPLRRARRAGSSAPARSRAAQRRPYRGFMVAQYVAHLALVANVVAG